jgi:hypothetical protein
MKPAGVASYLVEFSSQLQNMHLGGLRRKELLLVPPFCSFCFRTVSFELLIRVNRCYLDSNSTVQRCWKAETLSHMPN